MKVLAEANVDLKDQARKQSEQLKHNNTVLEHIVHLSMLISFKLADMVNIALDEGNYFRSEEWC